VLPRDVASYVRITESSATPLKNHNICIVFICTFLFSLPVVLYECETWSLVLKEEHRLRLFENRVLRRILGPKRDVGESRKLHNEEINDLYSLTNIIRVLKSRRKRWAGLVARMGERRGAYRI